MLKKCFLFLFLCASYVQSEAQTTDLAVLVEAQNTSNTEVSQVHIYQEFQYILTILNSGNLVNNATFTQDINANVTVVSFEYQNATGGAGIVTDLILDDNTNNVSGTITSLPTDSSIEVKVTVIAPTFVGGIATNVTVFPPSNTTDIDNTNNQSIISLDVTDLDIDFTVVLNQITPNVGTPINVWGDNVTYQFTIRNNSSIAFPLDAFEMSMVSNPVENGEPDIQVQSLDCIATTNGVLCPDLIPFSTTIVNLGSTSEIFAFNEAVIFPVNGTITIEIVVKFLEGPCAEEPDVINIESIVEIGLSHDNISPNQSNIVNTLLLTPEACLLTDLAIETEVIQPTSGGISDWDDIVILETVVSNLGTFPVPIQFFLQNLTSAAGTWNLISVTCTGTTGPIDCSDLSFSLNGQSWNTLNFDIPAGATITIQTVLNYLEPQCSPNPQLYTSQIRSAIVILPDDIIDIDYSNNFDDDFVVLFPAEECTVSDLTVTKTQIDPQLPIGGSDQSPMPWGNVTYEITVSNIGDEDTYMTLVDLYANSGVSAASFLRSVDCVSSTGGASCGTVTVQNIDVEIDQDSADSTFWEITENDNWFMPSGSSVTFRTVHSWFPECSNEPIPVINTVNVYAYGGVPESNYTNNGYSATTYFTPCVDLIIQTFPSSSIIPINSTFNWVVDITNSNTSSTAIDATFSDILNPAFTIVGAPTCQVQNGTSTCITNFNVNGSTITGTIPLLEAASTIRILIPVMAPNYGGVFNNTADVFPSAINNEELTPETNISISNAQVVSPTLTKNYNPDTIIAGNISTLTFTINNVASNPAQIDIAFTDNLAPELNLVDSPIWVNSNGCTANFIGNTGDSFVGITDLTFPEGASSCTFSVQVTSDVIGIYLNDDSNFSNQNNINTSQTEATLTVIEDTSNVDIEVLKTVSETSVFLNDDIDFTITATNIGTTTATQIEILESLPIGYQYLSHTATEGSYDITSSIWSLTTLDPNQSESLTLTVRVISSENLLNVAVLNQVNEVDRDETNNEDSAETSVDNCLNIPRGISPNNDGLNDVFVIPCLELYPKNAIKIYNRYGILIYQAKTYKNDWNGRANRGFPENSGRLPVGTYFYILEISEGIEPVIGWVYLNY
ncbi:DUF7933 domain-containing protein [Psychroserpens ponticola]|uniref:Gliding motility-associated C-terminal domain-containing protein n=1 Tax=Psychroserpens ponticola TaxID=2932268 RepID=A0ABY7RXE1_9FLAO|nr:gliding motility-associated C-terminal domain-containing protein [Psychroserpens ponticola]WCO01779.1 gliding motility-associated C-terminal domain-containing protein [Psychroserpens ponticola]